MKAFSREEWEAMWAEIDPHTLGERMGLNTYAELVNTVKTHWRQRWPRLRFDNGRYVVHLEDALRLGLDVPGEYVAGVADDELRFDGLAFPLLTAARAHLAAATV